MLVQEPISQGNGLPFPGKLGGQWPFLSGKLTLPSGPTGALTILAIFIVILQDIVDLQSINAFANTQLARQYPAFPPGLPQLPRIQTSSQMSPLSNCISRQFPNPQPNTPLDIF